MLNVLHRTANESVAFDQPSRTGSDQGSPPMRTPPIDRQPSSSWPFGAKVIVAILAVLALAGGIGTIVGLTGDDEVTTDGSATTALQASIDDLTAERDALRVDLDAADDQITALRASQAALEAERGDVIAELATIEVANEALLAERADLEARVGELEATIADATEARDSFATELAAADLAIAELEKDLAVQKAFSATAVSQRDALAALFPMAIDATLDQAELAGDYEADITAVYCEGFSNCTTLPDFDEVTIVEASNEWLRVEIDGYVESGLFLVDGALFAVAESTSAVPSCDGVARQATVSLTLYAHGLTIDDDGGYVIDDLGASLLVQAPATGSCPGGLGLYGVELTPAG